ncbi:MAG: hypothetical protein QW046_04795 [Candidatus Micrarchaeaceae archaeon]
MDLTKYYVPDRKRNKTNEERAILLIYGMLTENIFTPSAVIYRKIREQNISISINFVYRTIKAMREDMLNELRQH